MGEVGPVWVGLAVDVPFIWVKDPHITLAYIPETQSVERLSMLTEKLASFLTGFHVTPLQTTEFGPADNRVTAMVVRLPAEVRELVNNFRQNLYDADIRFSTQWAFKPHISLWTKTIYKSVMPEDEIFVSEFIQGSEPIPVKDIFIEAGGTRATWHLRKK